MEQGVLFADVQERTEATKTSPEDLINKVKENSGITAILKNGEKARLFYSAQNNLCKFMKGSSRRGYVISVNDIERLLDPPVKDPDMDKFKGIKKFRDQALKATFTNDFIRSCLACPTTFEQWIKEGKKSAYEYNITTGCGITGQLVSIKTITDKMSSYYRESFLKALAGRYSFNSGTFEYNGYDGSINLEKRENGDFVGFLNKEYRNCGNGYYYLLINDEYFIGYDID